MKKPGFEDLMFSDAFSLKIWCFWKSITGITGSHAELSYSVGQRMPRCWLAPWMDFSGLRKKLSWTSKVCVLRRSWLSFDLNDFHFPVSLWIAEKIICVNRKMIKIYVKVLWFLSNFHANRKWKVFKSNLGLCQTLRPILDFSWLGNWLFNQKMNVKHCFYQITSILNFVTGINTDKWHSRTWLGVS